MTGRGVRVSVLAAIPSLPVPSPFCFSSCSPSSRHQLSPIHLSLGTALLLLVPSAPWFSLQFCPQWETHLVEMLNALVFQDYSGITQLSWKRSNNKIHGNV